jgi:integrase
VNCDGLPWKKDSFCHAVARTARRAGLNVGVAKRVSAYCLRHTYCVEALASGQANVDEVARQLGHASKDMVEAIYGSHLRHEIGHVASIAMKIGKK